jgi:hypothetical protein
VTAALTVAISACAVDKLLTEPEPGSPPPPPPVASRLDFTGEPGSAGAGDALAPVVVAAEDQSGQIVPTFTGEVTIALTGNGSVGGLRGTLRRNAVAGVATFDDLSLTRAGTGYRLEAKSAGLTSATSSPFDVAPTAAARLASSSGDAQTDTVAATLTDPYVVRVTDRFGNPIPGVIVDWTVSSGGGTIDPTTGPTDASGTARATHTLGPRSGSQAVKVTAAELPSGGVTFTATAQPGKLAALRFTQQPSDVREDRPIDPPVIVAAEDQFANRITGFAGSMTMSLVPLAGNFLAKLSGQLAETAVAGVATFDDLHINRPGSGFELRVSAANLTADSQPFTVRSRGRP